MLTKFLSEGREKSFMEEIAILRDKNNIKIDLKKFPCGGGLEYLHRIPASRKR
jgi:hypothetical protein